MVSRKVLSCCCFCREKEGTIFQFVLESSDYGNKELFQMVLCVRKSRILVFELGSAFRVATLCCYVIECYITAQSATRTQ